MKGAAYRFAAGYLILLFLFSLWILDTFVIERRMAAVQEPETGTRADDIPGSLPSEEPVITDTSWTGAGIQITLSESRYADTTIHLAEIELTDERFLRTALADHTYGRNITETVSEMAEAHQAILAVNGDYYGSRRSGYVIRNGVLYRSTAASYSQEDLCIWPDGNMTIILEGETDAEALMEAGVQQVLSFGPALIQNGEITVDTENEVGRAMASNPRTAIAMFTPLHYLFVVSDGRTSEDNGLSLRQLAEFLKEQGVQIAYNLDGGGSSTMVFMGEVINWPTTYGGRRSEKEVSDIVFIAADE